MKRFLPYYLASCFIFLLTSAPLSAVPARRGIITRIQPDGDTLFVRLHGDERHHWMTTEDSLLVSENDQGYLCYAILRPSGKIIHTTKIAHNPKQRTAQENRYISRKKKYLMHK